MHINELTERILDNLKSDAAFTTSDAFTQAYINMLIKNIILYVDSDISIYEILKDSPYAADSELTLKIPGMPAVHTLIAGNPGVLTSFAEKYSRTEYSDYDSSCREAITDFLDLNNGLFAIEYALSDSEVPGSHQTKSNKRITGTSYLIPVNFRFGTVTFVLTA